MFYELNKDQYTPTQWAFIEDLDKEWLTEDNYLEILKKVSKNYCKAGHDLLTPYQHWKMVDRPLLKETRDNPISIKEILNSGVMTLYPTNAWGQLENKTVRKQVKLYIHNNLNEFLGEFLGEFATQHPKVGSYVMTVLDSFEIIDGHHLYIRSQFGNRLYIANLIPEDYEAVLNPKKD